MEAPYAGLTRSDGPSGREPDLRERSAKVERLLGEVESMVGPPAWRRVEELVSELVALYGAGLARLMAHVSSGEPALVERLCHDDVASSLLLLHGLHPLALEERVRRALDEVRPYLGSHAGGVELVGIDESAVVRLRLIGTCHGCPSSRATVEHAIRRAIEDAAPEVSGVEVEGVEAPASSGLVGLRVRRDEPQPGARWVELDGVEALPRGGRRMVQVGDVPVAIFRHADAPLAYRNACADCGARLDGSAVDADGVLTCAGCSSRFDLARAGRALDGRGGAHLTPLPLLVEGEGARLAIPESAR